MYSVLQSLQLPAASGNKVDESGESEPKSKIVGQNNKLKDTAVKYKAP